MEQKTWAAFAGSIGEPVALYVHIPFCQSRCRYCDFASNVAGEAAMARYIDGLLREADAWGQALAGRPVATLFLGGGTPGLLPREQMTRLIGGLKSRFEFAPGGEWTLESNPEVTCQEKAECWRALGFNRLSLGLQAVQPQLLKMLGRRGGAEAFFGALQAARAAGFDNVNADLMASLPRQRREDLLESVAFAADAGVEHISLYSLVIHERTPLGADIRANRLIIPNEDEDRDAFAAACDALEGRGYHRYEISNFARAGRESRHNLFYWHCRPYLGLGTAAASCDNKARWCNTAGLEDYCARMGRGESPWQQREKLSAGDRAFERLMMGLRLTKGVDLKAFGRDFGFDPTRRFAPILRRWYAAGLAGTGQGFLWLTARGMDVQNPLLVELLEVMETEGLV